MASRTRGESSADIRARVTAARNIQNERFAAFDGIYCNAQMNSGLIRKFAWPDEAGLSRLKERMERLNMSARAFDRILRVARTIADLDGSTDVLPGHISVAIGYCSLDRGNYGSVF